MIRGVIYSQGNLKRVTLKEISFLRHLSWINAIGCDVGELREIQDKTKINIPILRHCFDRHELPRIHVEKSHTFIIFKALKGHKIITLGIILGKKYLITLQTEDLHFQLSSSDLKQGSGYALSKLLSLVLTSFSEQLDIIDEGLTNAEQEILETKNPHMTLFGLKRRLLYIKKALSANREVLRLLGDKEYFSNLSIESNQLIEMESTLASRLTDVLDLQSHRVSNNLNNIMKSFTVIASLLLLPMLISGIYGMNFQIIPLSKNPVGFYYALMIMIVSVFLMILFFKQKRWI